LDLMDFTESNLIQLSSKSIDRITLVMNVIPCEGVVVSRCIV